MWRPILLILVCWSLVMPSEATCFVSKGKIVLDKDLTIPNILDGKSIELNGTHTDSARMCYLKLTFSSASIGVQFVSSKQRAAQSFAHEPSLTVITSIEYKRLVSIKTQLIYACNPTIKANHRSCNVDYYYRLVSDNVPWLSNQNHSELAMDLQSILYGQKGKVVKKLKCFVQNNSRPQACAKGICFRRQINSATNDSSADCGIPNTLSIDPEKDDVKVKMNIETRLCLNGMESFEFFYTCNTNKCNGENELNSVNQIISKYYDISDLRSLYALNDSAPSTSYYQIESEQSDYSTIKSTSSTTIRQISDDAITTTTTQSSSTTRSTSATKAATTNETGTSVYLEATIRSENSTANYVREHYLLILSVLLFL